MSKILWILRTVLAIAILALLILISEISIRWGQKAALYASGKSAVESKDWQKAFNIFYELFEKDHQYQDVSIKLSEASRNAILYHAEKLTIEEEIKILRWYASTGDLYFLTHILNSSTVYIPAGEFIMGDENGDTDERPQRFIYLDAYKIDRYEVTNVQYQHFVMQTVRKTPPYWTGTDYPIGQADYPVVGVGWEDAKAYCTWINKQLPTEAEWEKACRGPGGNIYPWGNQWKGELANTGLDQAEYWPNHYEDGWKLVSTPGIGPQDLGLRKVGSYLGGASWAGVLDMVGNASEWVADWYDIGFYSIMPFENPFGLEPPWNHSVRGRGWFDRAGQESLAVHESRCSARNASHSYDTPWIGFRCAKRIP